MNAKFFWAATAIMSGLKKLPPDPKPIEVIQCPQQTPQHLDLLISVGPPALKVMLDHCPPDFLAEIQQKFPRLVELLAELEQAEASKVG